MTPAAAVITMAPSDVAVASRSDSPTRRMNSGTATMPPPTPKNAEKTPAASPMATRRTRVSYEHGQSSRDGRFRDRRRGCRRCGLVGPPAADRNGHVYRPPRPPAVPEPDVRWVLAHDRERRSDSLLG